MKIAVTGKGGAGKTTIVYILSTLLNKKGHEVFVVDADPDMNLPTLFGIKNNDIVPITELKELIAERTGVEPGKSAPFFKMNPKVNDIPDEYSTNINGIKLMVMGTIRKGGAGCACPENAFLKTLLNYIMLSKDQWVICDMEAGIEHLGRGTAIGVDSMLIIVEPNITSIETARRIIPLARDIGIKNLFLVANKMNDSSEEAFIRESLPEIPFTGSFSNYSSLKLLSQGKIKDNDIEDEIYIRAEKCLENILNLTSVKG